MSSRVVVITGTSTGVGKTVVTAALAANAARNGERVVVVKPVQTGAADGDSDAHEVHRLTGCAVQEHAVLDLPLAPDSAARRAGIQLPTVSEHADRIRVLSRFHDTVLVEGAGGLLVRLDTHGGTVVDLAEELADPDIALEIIVVCAAGLGTLNHTELTLVALRQRGLEPTGLVIGSWPETPGVAERSNEEDLPRITGVPVLGRVPEGSGALDRAEFVEMSPTWFPAPTEIGRRR